MVNVKVRNATKKKQLPKAKYKNIKLNMSASDFNSFATDIKFRE